VSTAFGYSFVSMSIFVANKKQVWYGSRFCEESLLSAEIGEF